MSDESGINGWRLEGHGLVGRQADELKSEDTNTEWLSTEIFFY